MQRDLDEAARGGALNQLQLVGLDRAVLQGDALLQAAQSLVVEQTLDLHEVGLRHLMTGMGQLVGELTVVGQDQQTVGVGVQTPDMEEPLMPGHVLLEAGPALRIVHRRDDTSRLVEHEVEVAPGRRNAGAVHPDDIPFRIDAGPLLGDNPAVDLDASLGDQLLARPSAGYARLRERLLQAQAFSWVVGHQSSPRCRE